MSDAPRGSISNAGSSEQSQTNPGACTPPLAAPLAHAAAAAAAAGHGRVQRGGGTRQQAPDSRLQKRPWAPHHEGWDSKGPAWVPAHIPLLEEHAADGQEGAAALFAPGGCLCSSFWLGGAAPTAHSAELRIGLGMSTREPALQCCQWARVPPILPPSPNGTGMHARHSRRLAAHLRRATSRCISLIPPSSWYSTLSAATGSAVGRTRHLRQHPGLRTACQDSLWVAELWLDRQQLRVQPLRMQHSQKRTPMNRLPSSTLFLSCSSRRGQTLAYCTHTPGCQRG